MILKIAGVTLIICGVLIAQMGSWSPEATFWFGPYEEDSDSEKRRKNRLKLLGVTFVLAGILLLKFGVTPD